MKNLIWITFLTIISLQITSCNNHVKKTEKDKEVKVEVPETETVTTREPTDDEIREFGIIKDVEDGPYPNFVVTVEFPERQMEANFSLNIEMLSQTHSELIEMKGSYATIYYLDEEDNMLADIHFEGNSLYGEYAPELDDSFDNFSGTLSGADTETGGDLPDTITITNTYGMSMSFKEFITTEIAAKNGKEVTAYYYIKYNQTITYLEKSVE